MVVNASWFILFSRKFTDFQIDVIHWNSSCQSLLSFAIKQLPVQLPWHIHLCESCTNLPLELKFWFWWSYSCYSSDDLMQAKASVDSLNNIESHILIQSNWKVGTSETAVSSRQHKSRLFRLQPSFTLH